MRWRGLIGVVVAVAAGAAAAGAAAWAAPPPDPPPPAPDATAQPAAPPAAAPSSPDTAAVAPCAIHAWPARRVRSVTQGDALNHRVDEALRPGEDSPGWSTAALTPEAQRAALAGLPLGRLLGLPGAPVTLSDTPVSAFQARSAHGRLAGTGEGCVTELVVLDVTLEAAPFAGRSLRVALLRRDFAHGAATPTRRFQSFVGRAITTLPKPGEAPIAPVEAVDAELGAAFRLAIEEFARRDEAARGGKPGNAGAAR